MVPPGIGPAAVNAGCSRPVTLVGHHHGGVVAPAVTVQDIGIAVEARFQVLEVFRHVADASLIRIGAEAVPGLLEGSVVAAEIQPVLFSGEGKTIGSRVAGVLEVVLAEFLGGSHVQRPGVHVGNLSHRVLKNLSAGVRGEELVFLRNLQMAYQGILQLPDNGVRFVVFHGGPKADQGAFRPDFQPEGKGLPVHAVVVQEDGVGNLPYKGRFIGPGNLDFFLLRGVVIQAPEGLAAGVVVSPEGKLLKAALRVNFYLGLFQLAAVPQHEAADVVVEGVVPGFRRGGQLGEGIGARVEGDGFLSVETGILEFLHVMAHAVLEGVHIGPGEGELSGTVRSHHAFLHFVQYCGILEFQLHAAHVGLPDGGDSLGKGMALTGLVVPVPVGLHPGLVYPQVFPVFVAGAHVIGNPVEALSGGMAILSQGGGNHLPVLVAAVDVDVVGKVNLFRSNVEAGKFQILGIQFLEHGPCAVDVPVQGLETVLRIGKIQPVTPVGGGGGFVGEVLEHDGIRNADDYAPFPGRCADASGHLRAGLVQFLYTAFRPQPEVQLILPDFLVGAFSGPQDKGFVMHPVAAFQEEEGLEQPMLGAVGGLPAHMGGKTGGVPVMGRAVPVSHQRKVLEGAGLLGFGLTCKG